MLKSSNPNTPSTWLICLCPHTHIPLRTFSILLLPFSLFALVAVSLQCLCSESPYLSIKLYHIYVCYMNIMLYIIIIIIIIASSHSAAEHRASTRIFHLTLFLPSALISAQVLLIPLASSSTVLRHVFFGLPLPCLPWGFHSRACLAMPSDDFHSVWPSHVIYSVRYYPRFHVTADGLGTYYPQIWGHTCTFYVLQLKIH
jgi:hypothetical protein